MGQYNKAVLTTAGENLIARALAGEIKLNITKAKTSSYAYPSGTDLKSLTDMQGIKQTAADPATAVYDNTMIQTRVLFSNEEIVSTYYIHNIGLYAMDGTQEVLFCIVTAETPDEMPQYNGVASTSYIYNIQNVVQDAAQLNITVNPSGTATIQDVLERVDATGGDISETVIKTLDTVEDKFPVPAAGESVKRFFGKVLTFLRNIRPLTGDITIYVSANTGSDTTGDGSQLKPFKTIQHAIDILPKDLGGYFATINVASGTYAEDIQIIDFCGGGLFFYSDTRDTIADTCKLQSMDIKYNSAYVLVDGFTLTTTTKDAITVWGCLNVRIFYCQATGSALTYLGIYFGESSGRVTYCKIANRNYALNCNNSQVYSGVWDAGSTGNSTGLASYTGSTVYLAGNQPTATTPRYHADGGQFVFDNGTQITGLISSGLSCTWATIQGGYYRVGNLSGTAQIIVQLRLAFTENLTGGVQYIINGFPTVANGVDIGGYANLASQTLSCYMAYTGQLRFAPKDNTLITGNAITINYTYITNS